VCSSKNNKTEENLDKNDHKFTAISKIYTYFCNHKLFLNNKILNFFFHIIYLSIKDFEFSNFKFFKKSKFTSNYKILFIFLQFGYFITNSVNNLFGMNSEKFFEKKKLTEFLIYYKFLLFMLFLNKNNKFFYLLNKFSFHVYFKYVLYSIFYFINVYILNLRVLKAKKKAKKLINYNIPVLSHTELSNLYYKTFIYKTQKSVKSVKLFKEDLPLHLFCSNRVNYKVLDDTNFSVLLNNIRHFYRLIKGKKEENSFIALNEIIKKAIPLSKIIYQRRGRNLIPLMTFIYNPKIRNSLGFKYILKETSKVKGPDLNSYESKLLIHLLDILTTSDEDFIFQSDKDSDLRKEAYNRGYYLKTLKAALKNTN